MPMTRMFSFLEGEGAVPIVCNLPWFSDLMCPRMNDAVVGQHQLSNPGGLLGIFILFFVAFLCP